MSVICGMYGTRSEVLAGNIVQITRGQHASRNYNVSETYRVYVRHGHRLLSSERVADMIRGALAMAIARDEKFDLNAACVSAERSQLAFPGAWLTPLPAFVPAEQAHLS